MAESESSGNSGIVAMFAIVLLVLIAGFIAWQAGLFGGGSGKRSVDINVNTPGQSGN